MALGSQQRTLTVVLLLLLALSLLLFGESLAKSLVGGLLQLEGNIFGGSSTAVGERQRQRAQHVKEVAFSEYHFYTSRLIFVLSSLDQFSAAGVFQKSKSS